MCGADVSGRRADEAKGAAVAVRLEEEAASAAASAASSDPLTAATAAAGAWLTAGLASSAGGNPAAGLSRLGVAAGGLEKALAESGGCGSSSAVAVLAAIRGSQGDCWRALGDAPAAAAAYGAAVAGLEEERKSEVGAAGAAGSHSSSSLDLLHARAVTLSKLGDLEYVSKGPSAAAGLYARALVARLGAGRGTVPGWAGAVAGGDAGTIPPPCGDPASAAALRVDAGLSAAKVGDALAAAGQGGVASEAFSLAAALAERAGEDKASGLLTPPAAARLARLRAFLASVAGGGE